MKLILAIALSAVSLLAQPVPPAPGRGGGRGGPGGGVQPDKELVKAHDKDGNGRLNREERQAAIAWMAANPQGGGRGGPGGGRGPGGPGGRGGVARVATPNAKLSPKDVKNYGKESLYDDAVLRTIFLEFEHEDWETELAAFYRSDVELPAKMTVDGKVYPEVGVNFRGNSSYFVAGAGFKRSLHISTDYSDAKQNLLGYTALNLLNSNGDPSFVVGTLFSRVSSEYIPVLKVNLMRVVINGENWGIYVNQQHFNSDFLKTAFAGKSKGARWKVPGSPGNSRGGLNYLSDDVADYKAQFEAKGQVSDQAWKSLINLTKVLSQTPPEKLKAAIEPVLDVDATLRYLALDTAFENSDGYWIRSSDYNIFLDEKGKFHIVNHDMNETMGVEASGNSDPMAGTKDPNKALYRLLAVPEWKAKYAGYVRDIAEKWMTWEKLGPIATRLHNMIAADVKADNRKLSTNERFDQALTDAVVPEGRGGLPGFVPGGPGQIQGGVIGGVFGGPGGAGAPPPGAGPGGPPPGFGGGRGRGGFGAGMNLKPFLEKRRKYLLEHPEIKK